MTVVNSPLAKLRVPAKTLDRIAPPSNGPCELCCAPAAPKLFAAARKVRSVLIGASRNLSRSSMRGMPWGSLAIHVSAGPETAAPIPTIVAITTRISRRATPDKVAGTTPEFPQPKTQEAMRKSDLREKNARLRQKINSVFEQHSELRDVTDEIALKQGTQVRLGTPFLERIQSNLQERARAIIERRPDLEHLFDD